jgi:hypothetical protein
MSIFALTAALLAASPAPAPAPAPIAPVAAQNAPASFDPSTDTRRVCVVDTVTGSRFPQKFCQTRAEWIAEGTDPLAKR